MLYHFAVVYTPPQERTEAGEVIQPDREVIAHSDAPFWADTEQEANGIAWRAVSESFMKNRNRLTVTVTSFR